VLFDVTDGAVACKSSNPVQPEISGNSGVAMANMERRNRRSYGNLRASRDERCDTLGAPPAIPFGGRRRIPACWVTELLANAKLIVVAQLSPGRSCARGGSAIP